jgi:hypothetical protein
MDIVLTLPGYRPQMETLSMNSTDALDDGKRITGGRWIK